MITFEEFNRTVVIPMYERGVIDVDKLAECLLDVSHIADYREQYADILIACCSLEADTLLMTRDEVLSQTELNPDNLDSYELFGEHYCITPKLWIKA